MIPIELHLAPTVYQRLSAVAQARGETVVSLLEGFAYRTARALQGADEVGVLWALGFTDAQIAFELGWTNHSVAQRRQRLHLPANRKVKVSVRKVAG